MVGLSRRGMLTGSWRNASAGIRPPWSKGRLSLSGPLPPVVTPASGRAETDIPARRWLPERKFQTRASAAFCYACAEACPGITFLPRRHTGAWDLNLRLGKLSRTSVR